MVFLHSGVGSAGEWKQVFSLWPEGYRLVAIDAYREGTGPGGVGRWSLDDYADQVYAVAEHVGDPVCLVGFSWGGATALRVAVPPPRREAFLADQRSRGDLWHVLFDDDLLTLDALAGVTAPAMSSRARSRHPSITRSAT